MIDTKSPKWIGELRRKFILRVATHAGHLTRIARSCLSDDNNEDQVIWSLLIRHVGDFAHGRMLISWINDLLLFGSGVISLIITVIVLSWASGTADAIGGPGWWARAIMNSILVLAAFFVALIFYLRLKLEGWLRWAEKFINQDLAIFGVSLTAVAGFGPIVILWLVKSSFRATWWMESIALATLVIGVLAISFMAILLIAAIISTVLTEPINRLHLPSQLPWALAMALGELSLGRQRIWKEFELNQQDLVVRMHTTTAQLLLSDLERRLGTSTIKEPEIIRDIAVQRIPPFAEQLADFLRPIDVGTNGLGDSDPAPVARVIAGRLQLRLAVYDRVEKLLNALICLGRTVTTAAIVSEKKLDGELHRYKDAVDELLSLIDSNDKLFTPSAVVPDVELNFRDPDQRRRILRRLEEAARAMAALSSTLPADHRAQADWAKRVYRERAEAIRELKTWVMLPLDCSRGDLDKKLREILLVVAQGNWGALEHRELPTLSDLPWWRRVLVFGRKCIIALLPLGIFLATKWFNLQVPAVVETWALSLVCGWTAVSLLVLIDVDFAEKISSSKILGELLHMNSKEGKKE